MGIGGTLLFSLVVAVDASSVAMTNGMAYPKLSLKRILLIGLFFGFFQFLMPVIGYFITGILKENFEETFKRVAAWISFGLLAFLGGKMLYEGIQEWLAAKNPSTDGCENCDTVGACTLLPNESEVKTLTLGKLFMQAIATSIDALAIGFTLQTIEVKMGLLLGVWGATAVIGVVTCVLSIGSVYIGKAIGLKLADKAETIGGIVLIAIGVWMLLG